LCIAFSHKEGFAEWHAFQEKINSESIYQKTQVLIFPQVGSNAIAKSSPFSCSELTRSVNQFGVQFSSHVVKIREIFLFGSFFNDSLRTSIIIEHHDFISATPLQ
jgi:hypothetical protein